MVKTKLSARSILRWIASWATMRRGPCLFVDAVSGREVFVYRDRYGQEWMANNPPWGFRVRKTL